MLLAQFLWNLTLKKNMTDDWLVIPLKSKVFNVIHSQVILRKKKWTSIKDINDTLITCHQKSIKNYKHRKMTFKLTRRKDKKPLDLWYYHDRNQSHCLFAKRNSFQRGRKNFTQHSKIVLSCKVYTFAPAMLLDCTDTCLAILFRFILMLCIL